MDSKLQRTLVLLKPSCVGRRLIGQVIERIENRGIIIQGMKMMQLDEDILRQHYAHLVDKPFFPSLMKSMMHTPVVALCLAGVDIVEVFRVMTGVTNGRNAAPGTLRGDFCMSGQANIIHASDSVENAEIELKRFFKDEELFDYLPEDLGLFYGDGEA